MEKIKNPLNVSLDDLENWEFDGMKGKKVFLIDNKKLHHTFITANLGSAYESIAQGSDPRVLDTWLFLALAWRNVECVERLKRILSSYTANKEYLFKEIGIPRTSFNRFMSESDNTSFFAPKTSIDENYVEKIIDYLLLNDVDFKLKKDYYIPLVDIVEIFKELLDAGVINKNERAI